MKKLILFSLTAAMLLCGASAYAQGATSEEIASTILTESSLPIAFDNDSEYPWVIDGENIVNGNVQADKENTHSILSATLNLDTYASISFDIDLNIYAGNSNSHFHFSIDGQPWQKITYYTVSSTTINFVLDPGTHIVEWGVFNNRSDGLNSVKIRNMELKAIDMISVTTAAKGQVGYEAVEQVGRLDNPAFHAIKVTGPVGEAENSDWDFFKQMLNINVIDLSAAQIEYLPDYAFKGLSNLMYVILPEGVSSIGREAFTHTKIHRVNIPTTVTSIGYQCFWETPLRYCTFATDSKLDYIAYGAFFKTRLEEFYMPNSVSKLGRQYFYDNDISYQSDIFEYCYYLKHIEFSDNLSYITRGICYECSALEYVKLPKNLETIDRWAFYKTSSLTSIDFPESLREIRQESFYESGLNRLYLPKKLTNLGTDAFKYNRNLKYVELPSYVQSYNYTFVGCNSIDTIVCTSPTPPSIDNDILAEGRAKGEITLLVPKFAVTNYILDNYWRQFNPIEAMEIDCDYWRIAATLNLYNDRRMGGTPDVDLYYGGHLSVGGTAPATFGNFQYFAGDKNSGTLVNNTELFMVDNAVTYFPVNANYWYCLSPLYDVTLSEVTHSDPNASFIFRYYDGANRAENGPKGSWKDVDDNVLHAGIGYIVQTNVAGTLRFPCQTDNSASMFRTEEIAISLETHEAENITDQSWNLVANPFPAFFDIYYLDFTAPITCWLDGKYVALSITDDQYALMPMQAFFVQKPDEIDNIVFPPVGRQHTSKVEGHNAPARVSGQKSRTIFDIVIEGEDGNDRARVVLNEEKSLEYEINCDASKFMSYGSVAPQIYTFDPDGNRLAINERPQADGFATLGISIPSPGLYTISNTRAEGEALLIDNLTGETHNLANGAYTFDTAEAGEINDRFTLSLSASPSGIGTISTANAKVSATDGGIAISGKGTVKVINMAGMRVYQANIDGECVIPAAPGVYVVTIDGKASKVIVK